jgi:hypothetical protein
MTNETQEQVEREGKQSLVGKLVEVGRNFLEYGICYRPQETQVPRNSSPERTEENERKLQDLFTGTPLYQILEEQQKQWPHYDRRTPLNQFADSVRTDNIKKAFRQISDPVKDSYSYWPDKVINKEEARPSYKLHQFIGYYSDGPYGLNPSVIKLDSIKLADVSIVTGRLARKVNKDPAHYYKIASLALSDASMNIGCAMFHFGPKRLGEEVTAQMNKACEEISRREQIIGRELGRG